MKNYTSIFVIMLLLLLGACNQDDELAPNGRVDLTRNTISSPRWMFVLPIVDSIYDGIPYYKPFPHYQANSGSRIVFGLKRLNVENSVYLRTTEYPDINGGPELYYCYDTIKVQTNNNDSIICKIAGYANNDTIRYSTYIFHGKYNKTTGNVEGFVYPGEVSAFCTTCPGPGRVSIYYRGIVPAMFVPYGP